MGVIAKAPNDTDPMNAPNHNDRFGYVADAINSGWVDLVGHAFTYASASDPWFTMTVSGDQRAYYFSGQFFRCSQVTGGTKYFKIVVGPTYDSGTGLTTITLYGGTNYNLENETISSPVFSFNKAPLGTAVHPFRWTETVNQGAQVSKASPGAGTFYQLSTVQIVIPPGAWKVNVQLEAISDDISSSDATSHDFTIALSTSTSSVSNGKLSQRYVLTKAALTNVYVCVPMRFEQEITLSVATTFYLIMKSDAANVDTIGARNIYIDALERHI